MVFILNLAHILISLVLLHNSFWAPALQQGPMKLGLSICPSVLFSVRCFVRKAFSNMGKVGRKYFFRAFGKFCHYFPVKTPFLEKCRFTG